MIQPQGGAWGNAWIDRRTCVGAAWDRVDLQRGIITLRGVDTKANKPRQVLMTAPVKATLRSYQRCGI